MPWKETSPMDQKIQFIADFSKKRFSFLELCERYEISRKTGYKWVVRYFDEGPGALEELPRKPHHSPNETDPEIVAEFLELRRKHASWGGKKILKIVTPVGSCPAGQRSVISSNAMEWSPLPAGTAGSGIPANPPARSWLQTMSGALILKDNLKPTMVCTASPSPSPTTSAATFLDAKLFIPQLFPAPNPFSSACSRNTACPPGSALTMASHSPPTPLRVSRRFPLGGSVWESSPSSSSPVNRSKMAGTNGCIKHLKPRRLIRRPAAWLLNSVASTGSAMNSTMSGPTRLSICRRRRPSIPLPHARCRGRSSPLSIPIGLKFATSMPVEG
jgi:hypothetical protein